MQQVYSCDMQAYSCDMQAHSSDMQLHGRDMYAHSSDMHVLQWHKAYGSERRIAAIYRHAYV